MSNKLLRVWIIGSVFILILFFISEPPTQGPFVTSLSPGLNAALNILIALSPLGGLVGALGLAIVLFIVNFFLEMIGIGNVSPKRILFGTAKPEVSYDPIVNEEQTRKCPFAGKIVFTVKDGGGALGFKWDAKETEFVIKDDWKVYDKHGVSVFGFVDEDGVIHEGGLNLDGSVDLKAKFAGKDVLRIGAANDVYDMKGNRVAEFWK